MSSIDITFEQARQRGKGIALRCGACGRTAIFRAIDFDNVLKPGDLVADRRWRCRVCRGPAVASIVDINRLGREELAQWTPPPRPDRRRPTRAEIMRAICCQPNACAGPNCFACMGRANAVMQLYERP